MELLKNPLLRAVGVPEVRLKSCIRLPVKHRHVDFIDLNGLMIPGEAVFCFSG